MCQLCSDKTEHDASTPLAEESYAARCLVLAFCDMVNWMVLYLYCDKFLSLCDFESIKIVSRLLLKEQCRHIKIILLPYVLCQSKSGNNKWLKIIMVVIRCPGSGAEFDYFEHWFLFWNLCFGKIHFHFGVKLIVWKVQFSFDFKYCG